MEADEETFPHNKATADMENKILAKKDIGGEWQCKKKTSPVIAEKHQICGVYKKRKNMIQLHLLWSHSKNKKIFQVCTNTVNEGAILKQNENSHDRNRSERHKEQR